MNLTNQKDQFETILDSISDGVFTVDENWHITYFNNAAEKITGVPREEAIGERCCDVFRASICETGCVLRETLKTGKPVINKAIYIINFKGERIPISISTAILHDSKGNIIGGAETFRDLSMVEQLKKELESRYSFEDIISKSPNMQHTLEVLPVIAQSNSTVLIQGASGTGKELLARAIHNISSRHKHPFIAVNCGALPDNLLESELFGYKAGAFTDAKKDKPGRFKLADKGTIFLDEMGDISPMMQVRLLRFLQERTFEPLGSTETLKVDVRVIIATNKNLQEMVEVGEFREDLYYRLNVITLDLPPLQQRKEDIPLLTDHFISKYNKLHNKDIVGVSPEVMRNFMSYNFPGNIRELENFIEHAFVLCSGGIIQLEHLPDNIKGKSSDTEFTTNTSLEEFEKHMIKEALNRNHGNRQATADELGIHKTTLFRKIRRFGITLPEIDGRQSRRTKE
jgi:PAS domain S-box-containing protein